MILPAERFLTRSLKLHPEGESTARILAAALSAVDPSKLIKRSVSLAGSHLLLKGHRIDLNEYQRIFVVGIGKAARSMTLACAELLGDRITRGFLLTKPGGIPLPEPFLNRMEEFKGGHPLPDQAGMEAAQVILQQVADVQEDDLVLVLISGGGSALFTLPHPDLSLDDLIKTNQLLLDSGADIQQINTIRKHLSRVKGGRLAQALFPAKTVSLILSDVPGNQLDCVASGPTLPDPTSYQDGLEIISRFRLAEKLPGAVLQHLEQGSLGRIPETPKPGDAVFSRAIQILIGSNQDALEAGLRQAKQEGFHTHSLAATLEGEASAAGVKMAESLQVMSQAKSPRPACVIAGGETTVTLSNTPHPGSGGRNLELALSAVESLAGLENCLLISLASDGEDGNTDAAGAVVTGETLARSRQAGLEVEYHLRTHDSFHFFQALDDLIRVGPTGTNVNDLCFLLTYPRGNS